MANFLRLQLFMWVLCDINFGCSGQSLNLQVKDVLLKVGCTQASSCPFLPNPPYKVENIMYTVGVLLTDTCKKCCCQWPFSRIILLLIKIEPGDYVRMVIFQHSGLEEKIQVQSRTSTNGRLSRTPIFFFGRQSIHSLVSTSLQWPLSSFPKVAVLESFICIDSQQGLACIAGSIVWVRD